jgi:hypothetical protein
MVAIFGTDGAVAAALQVLLDLDVAADRVVVAVRKPGVDFMNQLRP